MVSHWQVIRWSISTVSRSTPGSCDLPSLFIPHPLDIVSLSAPSRHTGGQQVLDAASTATDLTMRMKKPLIQLRGLFNPSRIAARISLRLDVYSAVPSAMKRRGIQGLVKSESVEGHEGGLDQQALFVAEGRDRIDRGGAVSRIAPAGKANSRCDKESSGNAPRLYQCDHLLTAQFPRPKARFRRCCRAGWRACY